MTDKYLQGRVAWITGGATGMGRAIALALARVGAEVAIGSLMESERAKVVKEQSVYLLSPEEMERTRQEIEAFGVGATALPLDVGSLESVQGFFRRWWNATARSTSSSMPPAPRPGTA